MVVCVIAVGKWDWTNRLNFHSWKCFWQYRLQNRHFFRSPCVNWLSRTNTLIAITPSNIVNHYFKISRICFQTKTFIRVTFPGAWHINILKRWRATACWGKSKFAISSGWLKNGSVMSSVWQNSIFVTHPDEIPISAKSSGWHMVVWYVIRMAYCSVHKSSRWDTTNS